MAARDRKAFKSFDASHELLMERIKIQEEEIETDNPDNEMNEREKSKILRSKRGKSIGVVQEEVEVLIDTHFFNVFSESKSSGFLKKAISNQSTIDTNLLKKTRRTMDCSQKTMKTIWEIRENIL